MKTKHHVNLVLIVFLAWLFFYLIGIPSDYFMKYNHAEKLLIVLVGLFAAIPYIGFLTITFFPYNPLMTALRLTIYASIVPFILDLLFVGFYASYGLRFLITHWYLTIGYIGVWIIIPPIGIAVKKIKTN